ncbi:carbon-nitrogen hydrolase family protein [Amphibiibacter pelophylacis]|uniref:Carbon-nitrogen hydrolase family protein n=1 Tax=Amphibiibacter pelophylacis TaxID=1799477 RepID=A0ACC6P3P1_9BURK
MKVAAIQMISGQDVARNLRQAQEGLERAAAEGARLALLPEYFCLMGRQDTDKLAIAEDDGNGPLQDFLAAQAQRLDLWLVGGTLPLRAPQAGRVYNSALVYAPDGSRAARYDKMHLFAYDNGRESYDEARVLTPGQQPCTFDCSDRDGGTWRVGLAICYDLRFPELFRQMMTPQACDLLCVNAAFTATTGRAHWDVLLRARAIENQTWLLASAQGGVHDNGRATWGHSQLIDPWGEVQVLRGTGVGAVVGTLSRERLAEVRSQLPALEHRRC